MAIGELFEVTLFQLFRGQVVINRWHYEQTVGSVAGALPLLTAFQTSVMDDISGMLTDDVEFTRLLVQNLNTPTDNAEDLTVTPAEGAHAGEAAPLPLALSFRSSRPDLSARYSYKRFAGFPLDYLVDGVFDTTIAAITAVGGAMTSVITSAGNSFKPVQVSVTYPGEGDPPEIVKNFDIVQWLARPEPSTQNTRKFGRGI